MSDSNDWILKIISGPHQGAEVVVRPGRLVIGAHSDDCDLVLQDLLVAPRHLALTLDKNTLTAEPLEGPAFLSGKRLRAAAPVPAFGFVTVGTTHLVLGPATSRWPLLSIADAPALEREPVKSDNTSDPEAAVATPADTATPLDPKKPAPPTPTQRKRALFVAGFGGVLLIVWVILWLRFSPTPIHSAEPTARERTAQILRGFSDAQSLTLDERDGRLTVSGYLENDSTHRELTALLRDEVPEVTLRVWSSPRVLETTRALLAQQNLTLELASAPDGALRVSGALPPRTDWPRIRQLLLAEVPGLTQIDENFGTPPTVSHTNPTPYAASPAVASSASQPLTIVALQSLGDGQGWLRLSDGRVYFRGARLPDGARLASIASDHALIEKNSAALRLEVGRDLTQAQPVSEENLTKVLP